MFSSISYWIAMLMIFISPFLLGKHFNIIAFWPCFWIIGYMIVYGALMALSTSK
jgi:hypothetical protein